MTLISRISSLLLLLIIVSCHSPVVGKAGSIPPSHQLWNELLKANVKTNGQVDYKGFIREKPKLESYLKLLSEMLLTEANGPKMSSLPIGLMCTMLTR